MIELQVTEDAPIELNALSDEPVALGVSEQIVATYADLSPELKQAFLQLAEHIAYIDADGQDYYDALYNALYPVEPPAELVSITAVYTQSGTVYSSTPLNSLKDDLAVTAEYSDGTTAELTVYTLSGSLAVGSSTITVTYEDMTDTFSVTVSKGFLYTPDMGLLGDQSFITKTVMTAQASYSETITDGALRLYCPKLGSASGRFKYAFDPSNFTDNCRLEVEFKIADVSWVASSNAHNGWIKWQTEKSTACATTLGFARYTSASGALNLRYFVGSTVNRKDVTLNAWHTLVIENANGKQTLTLDDEAIVTNANAASYTPSYGSENCLVFDCGNTNAHDIYINKIKLTCDEV